MKRYFNLIDEPWIPVRLLDGAITNVGIKTVLCQAHEIASIEAQSPVVWAALHRVLLAVLYRALQGPCDSLEAERLFVSGLPSDKIESYLEKWRDRFWLFHEQFPFGQIPSITGLKKTPWIKLACELNDKSAKVLFDHSSWKHVEKTSLSQASQLLTSIFNFSLGAGNSDIVYTKASPSATYAIAIPLGSSLEETLLFSLVPQSRQISVCDLPIWEREPERLEYLKSSPIRAVMGYADLYTWRARSILLNPEEVCSNEAVRWMAFGSGEGPSMENLRDPMVGYRMDKKHGLLPLSLNERGLWRNFDCILPSSKECAPLNVKHSLDLCIRSGKERFSKTVTVVGLGDLTKAKIGFWRLEQFIFPLRLARHQEAHSLVRWMLDKAESYGVDLNKALKKFAKSEMAHGGDRKVEEKDISNRLKQLGLEGWYWSRLEQDFRRLLRDIEAMQDGDTLNWDEIQLQWLKSIRYTLKWLWKSLETSLDMGNAPTLVALVGAEQLRTKFEKKLSAEIREYDQVGVN